MLNQISMEITGSTDQKRSDGLTLCGSEVKRFASGIKLKIMKSIRCGIHCFLNFADKNVQLALRHQAFVEGLLSSDRVRRYEFVNFPLGVAVGYVVTNQVDVSIHREPPMKSFYREKDVLPGIANL